METYEPQKGERVLCYSGPSAVQVAEVAEVDGATVQVRTFSEPGKQSGEQMTFPKDAVRPLQDVVAKELRAAGVLFAKGELMLQKVQGGYQVVSTEADIREGDAVPLVRIYMPHGTTVMGASMACPVDALLDPADFLN